jgi:F0F1-type ATP synthase delta subunit
MLIKDITVITATVFDETLKSILEAKLVAKFGEYPVSYQTDSSLIVGMKIIFADHEYRYDLGSQLSFIMSSIKS